MKLALFFERFRTQLPYVGYTLFYFAAFSGFLFTAFPYRVLRDRIVLDFAKEQRKSPHPKSLSIEDLGPAWGGVRAKGVRLSSPSEKAGEKPSALVVSDAVIKPSFAAALVGTTDVSFSAQLLGGQAEGRLVSSKSEKAFTLKLAKIDLKQSEGASSSLGLPVEGVVDGSLRLELPDGKGAKANGLAQFEITDLAFGDGKAKFHDQLAVPKVTVGTLYFNAEAKDGSLKIARLGAAGKDLDLLGEGRIKISDFLGDSVLECSLRFKVADGYRGKSDVPLRQAGVVGSWRRRNRRASSPRIEAPRRVLFVPRSRHGRQARVHARPGVLTRRLTW